MPNNDIIASKLGAMRDYLSELLPYIEKARQGIISIESPELRIIERLFLLIVDAAIDINTHIITRNKFESPDDYQGTFATLAQHKVLPLQLADKIKESVGLRNMMTHGYEKVQRQKMFNDIINGIDQYSTYMKIIAEYMEKIKLP
ncbi:MAG: HepT-like ribonuclease domain-containing protein [Patescibacteria group bacterium]